MSRKKLKILIAEDEPLFARLLAMTLKSRGMDVASVQNGHEVKDAVQSFHPDLVLLDIVMPQGRGTDVLLSLQTAAEKPPIIVLSNLVAAQEEERCRSLGASGFWQKSRMTLEDIAVAVERFLFTLEPVS